MILVVGGAGYIGSHVGKLLRAEGIPYVVFDNLEEGHRAAVGPAEFILGDLRKPEQVLAALQSRKFDLVMHFGAYISVGQSVREPGKYFENNTAGVLNLLEAMRQTSTDKFVFSSTAAVYGEPQYVPIDEDHPKAPTSPYGLSKLMVEQMLPSFETAHGLRSVCLRYFNAAGADQDGELGEAHRTEEHLIPLAIFAAQGKRPMLKVFGNDYDTVDGTCVRDYIHIEDLAQAHLLAVRHLLGGGGSRQYNLGNGQGFSVRQVIDTVERVSGLKVPHEDAPRRPGDPAKLIASSERIRAELGWTPQRPNLDDIVGDAWRWHESHPDGFGD